MFERFQFRLKVLLAGLAATLAVAAPGQAFAEYPDRPINLIVGFKAGGNTDASARAVAAGLKAALDSPVVVVNKPGASSMIAAKFVADARPDGYTLWFGSASTLMLQSATGKTPLSIFDDFALAGFSAELVPSIAVPISSPYQSIQDLVTAARENPGSLRWSHGGRGSAYMAAGAGFIAENGLDVIEVPFSGGSGSRNAIIGEQVDFGIVGEADGDAYASKLRALASFRKDNSGALNPALPAMGEEGVPFLQIDSTVGVFAPAGTPQEVLDTLGAAMVEVRADPAFRDAMQKLVIPVSRLSPEEEGTYLQELNDRIGSLAPKLN